MSRSAPGPAPANPFRIVFAHRHPHGWLAAVTLPDSKGAVPPEVLSRLPPAEAVHARTLLGYRQVQFAGGRLALHAACRVLGVDPGTVLPDERGAPRVPPELTASVSHKRTLAVALAGMRRHGCLGVDLEEEQPPRLSIARKVLRADELEAVADLPADRRWLAILLRFSVKEAIFKALDPLVRRHIGFQEVEVLPGADGVARVLLHLSRDEGRFAVDARYERRQHRLITSVRVRLE